MNLEAKSCKNEKCKSPFKVSPGCNQEFCSAGCNNFYDDSLLDGKVYFRPESEAQKCYSDIATNMGAIQQEEH